MAARKTKERLSQAAVLSRRLLRKCWKWTRRGLWTLTALVALILTTLAALMLTPPGRTLVLDVALDQTNALVPGTIEVRSLERLSLLGVELRGVRVLDPEGTVVATVEHAAVETDLSGLMGGTIALSSAVVQDAWVDLRVLDERRGLLAAFVDPDAPESPPSPGPPPNVVVKGIEVRDVLARLPRQDPGGQVDVTVEELLGSYGLIEGDNDVDLERLVAHADREGTRLMSLKGQARLPRERAPAKVDLELSSGPTRLSVQGEAIVPLHEGWDAEPLSAHVHLEGLTAEHLADLLQDEALEQTFLGEVALHLDAEGTAQNLNVDGALETAGGTLSFDELSAQGDQLRAVLSTDGIQLNEVREDLPPRKVALQLTAETSGLPPDPVAFSVSLRQAELDDEPLLDLDVSGRFTGESIQNVKVRGRDGDSRIEADGSVDLDGAADLAVRVDLRAQLVERLGALAGQDLTGRVQTNASVRREPSGHLVAEGQLDVQNFARPASAPETVGAEASTGHAAKEQEQRLVVDQLSAQFRVSGTPPDLSGKLSSRIEGAALGDQHLDEAELEVEGGLGGLDVRLDASGGQGALPQDGARPQAEGAELHMTAHVERNEGSTTVTAEGSGRFQGEEVGFDIDPTTVGDDGKVSSEGLRVELAGQRVQLAGELSSRGSSAGLDVEFGPIELAELSFLSGVEDLVGTVQGRAHLGGTTQVPVVDLTLTGRGMGLRDRPLANLSAEGSFDAAAGQAVVDLDVQSAAPKEAASEPAAPTDGRASSRGGDELSLQVRAEAKFRGGEGYAAALLASELDARLEVTRLDTEFLSPYLPPGSLPVDANLSTKVHASGSMKDPRLETSTRVTVELVDEPVGEVVHQLHYVGGELKTELTVRDALGTWAELRAQATLPVEAPSVQELGDALAGTAPNGRWEVHLQTEKRSLRDLELVSIAMDPEELPPFSTELRLDATHEPGQEPEIELALDVEQAESYELAECSAESLHVELRARHVETENELTVLGRARGRELLDVQARLPLALQPVLSGAAPKLGALGLTLNSEDLQLESLPFVCGRAVGKVSASVDGQDLLGTAPQIAAEVKARGFSLGSRQALDLDLLAEATSARAQVEVDLSGTGETADAHGALQASLPWTFSEGKVSLSDETPLDASLEFEHLPIAPLLPPQGPISYARGTLDAKVEASGTLRAPLLHGELSLSDVAFTSTSLAQPLRGVQAQLLLDGRKVRLEHFEAHDRDGVLTLAGEVDLTDMKKVEGRVEIEADEFPLRQRGQVVAVTNMVAITEATVTPNETRATLTLRDVDTWLESVSVRTGIDLGPHPEFVIDGEPAAGSELAERMKQEAGEAGEIAVEDEDGNLVHITIDADQRFWIKRSDFAVKLATLLETEIEGDEVRVNGDVTIDRGYLQLFGKVFDLTRESQLRFIGSSPPNPVLQLEAEHQTRGGSVVSVRITGRGDAPVLQFSIDGNDVEAGEAVQELFGSGRGSGSESDAGTQAKSFVSGLTAGVLATAARRELGAAAPIIMIDPSEKTGEGRVRAGFELDDIIPQFLRPVVTGAYLEGIVARESEGETSQAETQFGALLEIYFPKNLFTAGQYGPGTTWSVDFGWRL